MTSYESEVLTSFLAGGLLVGIIGHWLDAVVTFIRRK